MDVRVYLIAKMTILIFHKVLALACLVVTLFLLRRTGQFAFGLMAFGFLMLGGFSDEMYKPEGKTGLQVLWNASLVDLGALCLFCGVLMLYRKYVRGSVPTVKRNGDISRTGIPQQAGPARSERDLP